ncbi:MAG: tyrosine-type recombinase/integrase, partial [Gemmatimonas sp.]|nr:tyrosine-type recombinase/integrase [Gemmatimonas sp.]
MDRSESSKDDLRGVHNYPRAAKAPRPSGDHRARRRLHAQPGAANVRLHALEQDHSSISADVGGRDSQGVGTADGERLLSDSRRIAAGSGASRHHSSVSLLLISLPHQSRAEPRYLNAEEVERLAEAIDRRYRSLIYAGAYLGLRWSELAGVKRTSLDLSGERLFVVGALQRFGHDWAYTDQLKTTRSRRSLALAPFLVELLSEHLLDAPKSDFVF